MRKGGHNSGLQISKKSIDFLDNDSGNGSTEKDSKDVPIAESKDQPREESKEQQKEESKEKSKESDETTSAPDADDPVDKIRRILEEKLGLGGSSESVDHGSVRVKHISNYKFNNFPTDPIRNLHAGTRNR